MQPSVYISSNDGGEDMLLEWSKTDGPMLRQSRTQEPAAETGRLRHIWSQEFKAAMRLNWMKSTRNKARRKELIDISFN